MRMSKRRGLSELVGALFILLLLTVAFGFSLIMFNSFRSYQQAVDTKAQFNGQQQSQQLTYQKTVFGATAPNSPTNSTLPISVTGTAPSKFFPLTNENFTSNSAGWVFTRRYVLSGLSDTATGISGNFDPVTSVGSPSGPGEAYSLFTQSPPNGQPITGVMNWTASFSIDSNEYTSLQNAGSQACFSWGSDVTDSSSTGNNPAPFPNVNPTIDYMVINPTLTGASSYVIIQQRVIATASGTDPGWIQHNHLCLTNLQQTQVFSNNALTYNLVIYSVATLKNCGTATCPAIWKVYFDDVGVQLSLYNFYSSATCPVINVSQAPLSVTDLTFSITSSYTTGVTQYIYAYDFAQGSLVLLDQSTSGTAGVTRNIDLGGLVGGASAVQRFLESNRNAVISPQGCINNQPGPVPIHTDPTSSKPSLYSIILKIYAVTVAGGSAYTGTISGAVATDFYKDTSHFSVTLVNPGTSTIHLVSLWIIGASGATHFASTLQGNSYFEQWVGPGQSLSLTVSYTWTPGQYTIESVSDKGAIFTESVNTG
jgi:hypothetical protein